MKPTRRRARLYASPGRPACSRAVRRSAAAARRGRPLDARRGRIHVRAGAHCVSCRPRRRQASTPSTRAACSFSPRPRRGSASGPRTCCRRRERRRVQHSSIRFESKSSEARSPPLVHGCSPLSRFRPRMMSRGRGRTKDRMRSWYSRYSSHATRSSRIVTVGGPRSAPAQVASWGAENSTSRSPVAAR